jgi:hypothetical protein
LKLADPRADDHLSLPQLLRLLPLRAIKGDANTDIGASQVEEFLAFSVHADPNGRQRESGTDDVLAIAAGKQSQMLSPALHTVRADAVRHFGFNSLLPSVNLSKMYPPLTPAEATAPRAASRQVRLSSRL